MLKINFTFKNELSSKRFANMKMSTFFQSLGSPKFVSAPMVEQSSLPFRLLVRKYDVGLAYTPMIHAKNFIKSEKYRQEFINFHPITTEDQPLIAQFAGDCSNTLIEAGKHIEHLVSAVDLNLGCPQKIAKKGHYGAYFLSEQDLIISILTKMSKELKCPVTAKIRILSSDQSTLDFCQRLENTGIQLLTVHGRTIDSSKQYIGPVNWNIIKQIKHKLHIPVILNGGISDRNDALQAIEETGVDGVMSSEALLENPKLFSQQGCYDYKHNFIQNQLAISKELISLFRQYSHSDGHNQLRAHLFKILHRLLNGQMNHDLRIQLAEGDISVMEKIVDILSLRFRIGLFDEFKDNNDTIQSGLLIETNWYNRHRDEKAQSRVMARKKSIELNRKIEANNPFSIENKLDLLRERLNTSKTKTTRPLNF